MKGRLQEKNGYWYVIISRGGGLTPKWVSTGLKVSNNKRKATKMMDEIVADYETQCGQNLGEGMNGVESIQGVRQKVPSIESPLFTEIIEAYLSVAEVTVKTNTYEKYCYAANNHIVPWFKKLHTRIADLDTLTLQEYFNKKVRSGLSKKTLRDHKTVINQSVRYAHETLRILQYNPALGVKLGKPKAPIIQFYDPDQLKELLSRIIGKGNQIEAPVILAAYYGLRREEILGLQWSSINFKDETIVICRTAVKTNAGTVYADTVKSKSSYRTMPLFPDVAVYLKKLYNQQQQMKAILKKAYTKNQEVCKWDDGRLIRPDYVSKRFSQLIQEFGMPSLTFHQLRHSTASLLLNEGYSLKEIQEWLGHADLQSTLVYAHLQYKAKENMAKTIGSKLFISKMALQGDNLGL